MEKQLSTQVHSLRDDFKEKSISTNQHMTRLETLQAEVRHYGMWIVLFAVSHDTKIYIYFKICSPLFSFLKLWFVSCTKQQGLEVSAREALPLFCMLVLWCDDLIVRCETLLDHISIALCHVWASKQLHKVNVGLFSERRPCNCLLESLLWQRRTNRASVSFTGRHHWTRSCRCSVTISKQSFL